jgi:DNA-binding transcriptional ArsR family regulator
MEVTVDGKVTDTRQGAAPLFFDAEAHGVLANRLRWEIVMRTGARPWCATELAEATGYSRRHVTKAIKDLREADLVELVERKPGTKGRVASFYRAAYRFTLHSADWDQLPSVIQETTTANIVSSLFRDTVESLDSGRLHSDPHHVMMRDHRRLDQVGRERVVEYFLEAYERAAAEEAASLERAAETGEALEWSVFGLSSFRRGPERPVSP